MDAIRFDELTRLLGRASARRRLLAALAGGALSVAATFPGRVRARRRRKRLRRNQFGCVDVGGKCRGKDSNCCSGICDGKKPKKGQRDRSRCLAHDTGSLEGGGSCQAGQRDPDCGGTLLVKCTTSTGNPDGRCSTTTGNGAYCPRESFCRACRRDADCQPFCGAAAACVKCTACESSGGTACASPTLGRCVFPQP